MKLGIDLNFEDILDSDSDDVVLAAAAELTCELIDDIKFHVTEFLLERDFKARSIVNFCNTGEFL